MNTILLQRITEWQKKTFPKATPESKLAHLREEVEELDFDLKHDRENCSAIEEEYADCFLLLYGSAFAFGIDLDRINLAISKKMDKNEKREWGTPDPITGVVNHIRDKKE